MEKHQKMLERFEKMLLNEKNPEKRKKIEDAIKAKKEAMTVYAKREREIAMEEEERATKSLYEQQSKMEELPLQVIPQFVDLGETSERQTRGNAQILRVIRKPFILKLITANNFDFKTHFIQTLDHDTQLRIEMEGSRDGFSKNNPLGMVLNHMCEFLPIMLKTLAEKIDFAYRKDLLIEFEFEFDEAYEFVTKYLNCKDMFQVLVNSLEPKYRKDFPLFSDQVTFKTLSGWLKEKELVSPNPLEEVRQKLRIQEEKERRNAVREYAHECWERLRIWFDKNRSKFGFRAKILRRWGKMGLEAPLIERCINSGIRKHFSILKIGLFNDTTFLNKIENKIMGIYRNRKNITDLDLTKRAYIHQVMTNEELNARYSETKNDLKIASSLAQYRLEHCEMLKKNVSYLMNTNYELEKKLKDSEKLNQTLSHKLAEGFNGDRVGDGSRTGEVLPPEMYKVEGEKWFGYNVNERLYKMMSVVGMPPRLCKYRTEAEICDEEKELIVYYLCKLGTLTSSKQAIVAVNRIMGCPMKAASKGRIRWEETFGELFKENDEMLNTALVYISVLLKIKLPLNNLNWFRETKEKGDRNDQEDYHEAYLYDVNTL